MRKISNQNLNAYLANQIIDKAIADAGEQSPYKTVQLAKIILRSSPNHKLDTGVPIYGFVKNVGEITAIKVLTNGAVVLIKSSQIVSSSEIKGEFTISGVTYGVKDYINGFPRYKVKRK
jgi:hypothetical protein